MILLELLFVAFTFSSAVGDSLEDNIAFQMLLHHDKPLDEWYKTQDEISNPHRPKEKTIAEPLPGYVRWSPRIDAEKSGYRRRESFKPNITPSNKLVKSETQDEIIPLKEKELSEATAPLEKNKDLSNTSENPNSTVVERQSDTKIKTSKPNALPTPTIEPTDKNLTIEPSESSASPKDIESSENKDLPNTSEDPDKKVVYQPQDKKEANPNEKKENPDLREGNSSKSDYTEKIKSSESTKSAYTSIVIPKMEGKGSRNEENGIANKLKEKDETYRPGDDGQDKMEISRSVPAP